MTIHSFRPARLPIQSPRSCSMFNNVIMVNSIRYEGRMSIKICFFESSNLFLLTACHVTYSRGSKITTQTFARKTFIKLQISVSNLVLFLKREQFTWLSWTLSRLSTSKPLVNAFKTSRSGAESSLTNIKVSYTWTGTHKSRVNLVSVSMVDVWEAFPAVSSISLSHVTEKKDKTTFSRNEFCLKVHKAVARHARALGSWISGHIDGQTDGLTGWQRIIQYPLLKLWTKRRDNKDLKFSRGFSMGRFSFLTLSKRLSCSYVTQVGQWHKLITALLQVLRNLIRNEF